METVFNNRFSKVVALKHTVHYYTTMDYIRQML
jgi:hypothetical protein